ncbi:MAG: hypothetical protein WC677_05375 [Clostridia bacterium]|jgi:hypothetical protein
MKVLKLLSVVVVVAVLATGLAACVGDTTANQTDEPTVDVSSSPEPSVVGDVTPKPDVKASAEDLLGTWDEYISPDSTSDPVLGTIKITKTAAGYQWKDKQGTYQGTYKDGELTLKINATSNARVYIDQKTKRMNMVYEKSTIEFEKK